MVICFPWIVPALTLIVLWFFRSSAETSRRRTELASEELIEDVRSLASRDSGERIRPLLDSQDTPFSRTLVAVLCEGVYSTDPLDGGILSRLKAEGADRPVVAERVAWTIAGLLIAFFMILLALSVAGSAGAGLLGAAILLSVPITAAVHAIRTVRTLATERDLLVQRQVWLARKALFAVMAPPRTATGEAMGAQEPG